MALLLELARACVPHDDQVDFTVAEELLRLVALRPPDLDVRLDLVELAEGAVDVQREHLVDGHAVRDEGELHGADRVVEHRAVAGELLDVPEVGPGLRAALRELVLAVGEVRPERAVGEAIGVHRVWEELLLLHDRPVDRLDQAFALGAQELGLGDRGDVPLVVAALHLGLQLGVRHGSDRAHADAGLLGERLEEGGFLRGRPAAAPRVDVDRARLGDGALGNDQRSGGRRGGGGRDSLEERATSHSCPPWRCLCSRGSRSRVVEILSQASETMPHFDGLVRP
jgi:hypothetical protein